ncbi:MAG: hypothetical protein AAGA77_17230 [Bacteroidota bacterium]
MKNLISICLFSLLFITFLAGQEVQTIDIQNLQSKTLMVESDYLDMKIVTWNKDYVQIQSDVQINSGEDNDAHELETKNTSEGIVIHSKINTENIQKMVILIDNEGKKSYIPVDKWDEDKKENHFTSINFGFDIEGMLTISIPEDMDVKLESIYGDTQVNGSYSSIEVHSTYGLIESKLDDLNALKNAQFKSTYDIVDLALDKNSNVNLNLQTSYGEVFSDLPLQSLTKRKHSNHDDCYGTSGAYVLNDGDVQIDIVATYDNIYLRSY